jgi:hypothetical protein
LYHLKVLLNTPDFSQTLVQNFAWGVLAINPDQAVYLPGQEAKLGIAVLNDAGRMVCDASVNLTITDPIGVKTTLSTENKTVAVSPDCTLYGRTDLQDFSAIYKTSQVGKYILDLQAKTGNGIRTLQDEFNVEVKPEVLIKRDGPTRIFPADAYDMKLTVTPSKDLYVPIVERVPASYEITAQDGMEIKIVGDQKELTWIADLKKDQPLVLLYKFKTPPKSPEFYLVGPLSVGMSPETSEKQTAPATQPNLNSQDDSANIKENANQSSTASQALENNSTTSPTKPATGEIVPTDLTDNPASSVPANDPSGTKEINADQSTSIADTEKTSSDTETSNAATTLDSPIVQTPPEIDTNIGIAR